MAAVNGRLGKITFAATTDLTTGGGVHAALASAWNASIDRDTFDVTPFEPPSAAKKNLGGLHVMTGSISGFFDGGTKHDIASMTSDAVAAALVLTATTGRTYSCDAILSNWSVDVNVQGISTFSCNFISDGVISLA